MGIQGRFTTVTISQIFYLVHTAHKTGALHIHKPDGSERASLFMGGGQLLWASMQDHDGHLITLLHKAGHLSPKQAAFLHERGQGYSQKALALMLINANHITRADVVRVVQGYVREIAYDTFQWADDFFHFEEGALPPQDCIEVPIDLTAIILEGNRRLQETQHLSEAVPDLDATIHLTPTAPERFRGVSLTVEEWRLIAMIGPRTTIRQLARSFSMTDTEIRRVICKLMDARLVDISPAQRWTGPRPKSSLRRMFTS
jgi:hypothetical protein